MIKHIVLLKLKSQNSTEVLQSIAYQLKTELENLKNVIPEIRFYEVGLNIFPEATPFDMVINSAFDSVDELNKYRMHPAHIKVLDFINEVTLQKAVVDYQTND